MDSTWWRVVVVVHSRVYRFSGCMNADGLCRLADSKANFSPPVEDLSPGINIFISTADQYWLCPASFNTHWTCDKGIRWPVKGSKHLHSFNIRSDILPQSLSLDNKLTKRRLKFEIFSDTYYTPIARCVTQEIAFGMGDQDLFVAGKAVSVLLLGMSFALHELLERYLNLTSDRDALSRVARSLVHVLLFHGDEFEVSLLSDARQIVMRAQQNFWWCRYGQRDPLTVVNDTLCESRAQGVPFTDYELCAMSLAQFSSKLVVHLNEAGEIDFSGDPYTCERYVIHPGDDSITFFCVGFEIDTVTFSNPAPPWRHGAIYLERT